MPSTFSGLGIASSALAAQRRAIDTIGQNVANVNTAGYSRQRVDLTSLSSGSSGIHTGMVAFGGGVDVAAQIRIVDTFLTQRVGREQAAKGYTDVMAGAFTRIESGFDEPGENGLAAQLQGFWSAWESVVARPEDSAGRAALLQSAAGVTDTFRQIYSRIGEVAGESLQQAKGIVSDVNTIAARIADLNRTIGASQEAGVAPNEMMDERDRLVGVLSGYVGVTTRTDERGMMNVSIGGNTLVNGIRAGSILLDTTTPGAAVVRLGATNTIIQPQGGSIEGLLHVANTLVPTQLAGLDAVASSFMATVNSQHTQGQDLNGVSAGNLFSGTGAGDLTVDVAMQGRPDRVGAAAIGGGRFDASNAVKLGALAGAAGGPDERYRSMVAQLGIDAGSAYGRADLQGRIVDQIENERLSVSGVSIDEEMTNLVSFQQAYHAAARFMTAVDEMLERLINGTGQVGR